jgi:hypothetical protein
MGLKGAPSYFQHILQSEVLHGLIYTICELYIDDVIIFASSEEDMVHNLKLVLERLHSFGITVSPEKCSFGLEEIEFVGHTLDRHTQKAVNECPRLFFSTDDLPVFVATDASDYEQSSPRDTEARTQGRFHHGPAVHRRPPTHARHYRIHDAALAKDT